MATGTGAGRRRRRSEAEWREILNRCDASGLGAREFCKQEDLSLSTLQRWRARCRAASTAPFVEFAPPAVEKSVSSRDWTVELELPGGFCLRLRA